MGKYIYTYIENEQMYEESPSLAELLAREGFFCKKIVTGRIEYIKVKDFETQIKMHSGLCLQVKMLWLGLLIMQETWYLQELRLLLLGRIRRML